MHSRKRRLVAIDDDALLCDAVQAALGGDDLEVLCALTAREGIELCSGGKADVVLLDQKLPDADGAALCKDIVRANESTKIIFMTAYPSFSNALNAIRIGAHDYLSKPFELEELKLAVEQALRTQKLERLEQLHLYQSEKDCSEFFLAGQDGGLREVGRLVELAACSDAPVFITGETGTGKGVIAKAIHYRGPLKSAPFVSVNCASLPENLIEAELFGHERGAFTGASAPRKGLFELAEGGTLFLDEIAEMPLHLQSKLLGVLEDKRVRRLGAESTRPVNVRVLAATNVELESALAKNTFRRDLYYRLAVMRISLPALRERPQDVPELCRLFLARAGVDGARCELEKAELDRLASCPWPGNVRELKNLLERAALLQRAGALQPSLLLDRELGLPRLACAPTPSCSPGEERLPTLEEVEARHIHAVLQALQGNYSRSAKALGISLSTLKRKLKRYERDRCST